MSDLPSEDRSTVLLLGVTRIPTSPAAARRYHPSSEAAALRHHQPLRRNSSAASIKRAAVVRRNSSARRPIETGRFQVPTINITNSVENHSKNNSQISPAPKCPALAKLDNTTFQQSFPKCPTKEDFNEAIMESSIDSIGTCSLDVEASADLSDWSENSSTGTLRSTSAVTPSPEHHLPSYLSLACTVNGYSTTTNYDPIRLARSRDASPHRIDVDLNTSNKQPFSLQNNLLSPPNLVPLPKNRMENTSLTQQQFYSSKTMTFMSSQEPRFAPNIFVSQDSTDSCIENGHHSIQSRCVTFEKKTITSINGQTKCTSETSMKQEYSNSSETKSFIQQRVERLYGPGALAQGFLVMNRRLSESDPKYTQTSEKHSKSFTDKLLEEPEISMKQSTSSPTLPVLRHLRPEFRAQLPIISPKKTLAEGGMQKSVTVPKLTEDVQVNGMSKQDVDVKRVSLKDITGETNGDVEDSIKESGEKNGHYFLKILEAQTKRLLERAAQVENDICAPGLSEEVIGKLRSTAGKAKLLVSQKMQQFKGLCTNNINRSVGEAFPTTNEDLQGFWDMVMLQVDQVDAMFEEIDRLRKNNWQEIKVENKAAINGTAKPKKVVNRSRPNSAANEELRKQREAERKKMIEERRKAMRAQQKPRESIEIFVPESS